MSHGNSLSQQRCLKRNYFSPNNEGCRRHLLEAVAEEVSGEGERR